MTARCSRRHVLGLAAASSAMALAQRALAFGEAGAFHPRALLTGTSKLDATRSTAPARMSSELVLRTSAPAKLSPSTVQADDVALPREPFVWWMGEGDVAPLTAKEVRGLARFFSLGGVLLVDDSAPDKGAFLRSAKRELARVWADTAPISIGPENVVFRSYYLLKRAFGRVEGPAGLEAIMKGGLPRVIFSSHDLAGALARTTLGTHPLACTPSGEQQREQAMRLAVNIAMYVLCSNYKDDQVHAPFLMRRRSSSP